MYHSSLALRLFLLRSLCSGKGKRMYVGDKRLQLDIDQQRARGERVEAGAVPMVEGCTGVSCLSSLWYVDLSSIFVLPVAHALLYGVIKSFVEYILRPLFLARPAGEPDDIVRGPGRKFMREAAAFISVTSDFGRKYKCVEKYR